MLAERDLVFGSDVPEETGTRAKAHRVGIRPDPGETGRLNPVKDQAQIEGLLNGLRELRERQSAIVERIRQQSPRFASLQYPQPLDFSGGQVRAGRWHSPVVLQRG